MLNRGEKELKGKAVYGVNKFSDWTKEEFLGAERFFNPNQNRRNKVESVGPTRNPV
jgi:hypothetical protein